MAWNMSAAKRRALVKLQLRDKKGRWIEMGRGVKWYSSRFKREISGIVVDGAGSKAYVRLSKEDSGKVVAVEAHKIEVIENKAKLSPKGEKSALDTPEFEKPQPVSDAPEAPEPVADEPVLDNDPNDESAEPLADRSYPSAVDENDENSYKSTKTSDGKFYFGRADSEGIYTPAKDLQVGDELLAPDGTDDTKPFSIGSGWNRRGVERVAEGKGLGTVESIVPDRYAVVKLPEGYAAPDGRQTVTVGLRNDVIKATPGLKKSLESAGFKFNADSESKPAGEPAATEPVDVERGIMDDRRKRNNAAKVSAAQQGDKLVAERPEGALTFTKSGDNQWSDSDGGSGLTDEDVTATPITLNAWTPEPMIGKKPVEAPAEPAETESESDTPTFEVGARVKMKGRPGANRFYVLGQKGDTAYVISTQSGGGSDRFTPFENDELNGLKRYATPASNLVEVPHVGKQRLRDSWKSHFKNLLDEVAKQEGGGSEDPATAPEPVEAPVDPKTLKPGRNGFLNGYKINEDRELGKVRRNAEGQDYVVESTSIALIDALPIGSSVTTLDQERFDSGMSYLKAAPNTWVRPKAIGSRDWDVFTDNDMLDYDILTGVSLPKSENNPFEPNDVEDGKRFADKKRKQDREEQERYDAWKKEQEAAKAPVSEPEPVDTPVEPTNTPEPVEAPSEAAETPVKDVVEGVSRIEQDMEDILENDLQGEELDAALEEATFKFTAKDGLEYTIAGRPEGDGEWSYNVTDQQGDDAGNWTPGMYDSTEALATDIHATINKKRSDEPTEPSEPASEPVDTPAAANYNENGLTAEEQTTADALTRMIARAESQGNFEKADQLANQLAQMMRTGEERKAAPAPVEPEPAAAPKLIEPEPVAAPAAPAGKKTSMDEWKDSLDALMTELDAPEHKEAGNRITAAVQKMNGLDGAPTVVSKEAFDALPGKKVYRGVSSEDQAERFNTGPNWVGEGGSGSGIYTSTNRFRGDSFKRADGGALMEMKLNPDANVADGKALEAERIADLEKATAEGNTVGMFLADGDMGKYAAARGFDGYSVPPIDPYSDDEEYVVLTNRAAVSVLESPAKSEGDSKPSTAPTETEPVQAPVDGPTEPEPAPVEPVETSHIEFLETTPDGFKVRESETNPGYIEIVAPDGTVARRAKISEGDLENKIKSGMDDAREAYEARVQAQNKVDARNAAVAALEPFEPFEAPIPAKHFRVANNIKKGERLLTETRGNGTEGIINRRQSNVGTENVKFSGKSALVVDSKPIMGQNKTSIGKVVGTRATVEHTDGTTETVDLYANRGGTNDKGGVIIDSPEFREEFGLNAAPAATNTTEGQNGTDTGTEGTPEPAGTEADPVEGQQVSGPTGGDGGTGNDPASGTDPADGGEGTGSGSDSGLPERLLTKEQIDDLPDGEVIYDEDGRTLAKNEDGDWYSVADFLEKGEKDGLPSDMLAGTVTRGEGGRKYTDEELAPATNHFVANSFKNVNDYVRNGNDPTNIPGYIDTVIDVIDDAIANSPLEQDSTFFRGLQISASEAEKFVSGSIINDKGFTSVSKLKDIATGFAIDSSGKTGIPAPENHVPVLLQVNLPKGHGVMAVDYSFLDEMYDLDHQKESVLARDSSFKVDSVEVSEEDGKKFYTLQVSPATEEDFKAIPTVEPEPASVFPPGIIRREPTTVPGEKYPPTQQQQDVIDAVLGGLDTKVQAMAGTGKTSTLVALSRRIKEHGKQAIYIAFNKTVQEEAEERMKGLPVEAKTGHGVAYQWSLKNAPHLIARLNGGDFSRPTKYDKNGKANEWAPKYATTSSHRIAGMLDINNGDVKAEGGQDMRAATVVLAVKKTVEKYALSDKDEIGIEHVPDSFEVDEDSKQAVVDFAKKYWDDLNSETGDFRITHDTYRKIWALSRPDLTDGSGGNKKGANILYIDEAQDTPPVLAKVVADQKMQKVIVGDPNQAIYAFAENIDYLSEAEGDIELPLNKSWRFGPQVADIGNRFLEFLGSKDRVVGGGGESKITYGMEDADAVLVRTNAGMITVILEEAERGRRVSAPKGTKEDLTKLIKTVQGLMDEDPLDSPHDDLIGFKDWGQVLSAWNNGDTSLNKIVNLFDVVDAYSLSRLTGDEIARAKKRKMENAVKAIDMLVVKVPKSEGVTVTKEGDRTYITPVDVHPDPKMQAKWAGRNKQYAVENFSQEIGKVRAPEAFDKGLSWSDQMYAYHRKGGLETMGFSKDKRTGRWFTEDDEAAQKLSTYFGEFDVTVSTAHKSKGLEWDRVRIGDDFFVPRENPQTGVLEFPEDPAEYKLAYVAVTRAAKELDPGVLGWIYEHTSENGGDPNKVSTPTVDPVDSPVEPDPVDVVEPEPVNVPEPVSVPEPVDVPSEPEPAPAPVEVEPEPEPTPVPGYNENGYTEGEQQRVDFLENLLAKVFRGEAEGEVDTIEGELDKYYTASESRLNGVDVPEIIYNAPEPVEVVEPVSTPAPAPAPRTPAPAPTAPTEPKPRTRTNMSGVKVLALGGEELVEGSKVRHPKYTGTVIKVIPSAGTVRIRKEDGTEVIARGHKISLITEGAEPVPAPVVTNLVPGSAGVDPATGLPFFVGRDGKVFQIGDTIVHAKKGEGKVKSIYVGATSVSVDWADGTNNRSQANALFGKDNGGDTAPEPTDPPETVEPTPAPVVEPEPAPVVEPEPVTAPEPAPVVEPEPAAVKLTGQFTDPEPKSKLSVKGTEIEGGDPVGTKGPVSPHGDPLPGDSSDTMLLSMLYPTGSVITYHNKTGGVKYRIKKGDDFMWHELEEDGSMNLDGFHQYIPSISRVQMYVKVDPNGRRDTRNEAPDNEEFLNSIPVGGTVTTDGHWDGTSKVWTKQADGFWKNEEVGGALNAGVTRYNIIDFSGDDYTPVDAEGLGWTPFESGPTRKMKMFKLPNGAEATFSKAPNVHFVKENGKWSEIIRGQRTGTIHTNLNTISDNAGGWPAFVNMANAGEVVSMVPQRTRPASLKGDPAEIDAVFGSDVTTYKGVDTLFREYDSKTSPFNVFNQPAGTVKQGTDPEAFNSAGDKFVPGARVYDRQGEYLGKVELILASTYSGRPSQVFLQHERDQGVYQAYKQPDLLSVEDLTTVRTKHWDTSTDLDFSDFKTVSSIERKMNETYGGINFKLASRSTDIRLAREFSATTSKIFNKYPQIQEAAAFIGTQPFGAKNTANAAAWNFGPPGFGTYGNDYDTRHDPHNGRIGARVAFNTTRPYDLFVRYKKEGQKTRWNNFVEEGKEVEATTTHEFGHVLDYFTGVISEKKVLEFVSEVLGREITKNDRNLGDELFNQKLLSGYSLKRADGSVNPVELVAESFQDVEMNGEKAKELSKLVHQELMRRLAILSQSGIESVNNEVVSIDGKAV